MNTYELVLLSQALDKLRDFVQYTTDKPNSGRIEVFSAYLSLIPIEHNLRKSKEQNLPKEANK